MVKHAAAQGAGARVSGGFVVVMPAARFEVASAVVENAIIAGAPGAVTLVDRRLRRVDEQLGVGKYLRAVHADESLACVERVVGGQFGK